MSDWTSLFDGQSLQGWKEAPFYRRGNVLVRNGAIILGRGSMTGIAWTGAPLPRTNYEIRFEAARLEGKDFFAALTFPAGSSFCTWVNGGWGGETVGLSNVDGYDAAENETSTVRDFARGQWYAFRLRVTPKRIEAWIDERGVIDVDLTVHKVDLRFDDIDLCKPLGFASYATEGAVRKIELRRLA